MNTTESLYSEEYSKLNISSTQFETLMNEVFSIVLKNSSIESVGTVIISSPTSESPKHISTSKSFSNRYGFWSIVWIEMECFELIRKHLVMCGIEISKNRPFNVKNSLVFVILCGGSILIVLSLDESNDFVDYTNILFSGTASSIAAVIYATFICKTSKLSELINCLAEVIKESEY